MTMPFGKFKGWALADLPADYLMWLSTIELRPRLAAAVLEELRFRTQPEAAHQARVPAALVPYVAEIVAKGFRAAALAHHPDRGGDTRKMQRLNEANQWLREELELR